jgi:regulator of protease activity HflC (stomatin/prohibitin superfamily)
VLLRRAVATKQRQQRELAARVQQQQASGDTRTAIAPHFAKLDREVAQWQAEADTQKQILVSTNITTNSANTASSICIAISCIVKFLVVNVLVHFLTQAQALLVAACVLA